MRHMGDKLSEIDAERVNFARGRRARAAELPTMRSPGSILDGAALIAA
jgi:hypothetical protein